MKFKRIGICGSHSCGKTTLIRFLAKEVDLPLIQEIAATFAPPSRMHIDTQYKIMRAQIEAEKKARNGRFMSDRTVIDNLAYCTLVFRKSPYEFEETYIKCRKTAADHLKGEPYDLVIVVDELLPLASAFHRNFESDYEQKFILDFIKDMMEVPEKNGCEGEFLGTPYLCIKGPTARRIRRVLEYLETH